MKRKLSAMSHRYERALKCHLKQGPLSGLKSALRLGRQAASLGIEILGLARIHERALRGLTTFKMNGGLRARAENFFLYGRSLYKVGISTNDVLGGSGAPERKANYAPMGAVKQGAQPTHR